MLKVQAPVFHHVLAPHCRRPPISHAGLQINSSERSMTMYSIDRLWSMPSAITAYFRKPLGVYLQLDTPRSHQTLYLGEHGRLPQQNRPLSQQSQSAFL